MAKVCFTTPIQNLNILHPFSTKTLLSFTNNTHYFRLLYTTHAIPFDLTDTELYLPFDDPNIKNLMVSPYDCTKQHKLRQLNLLNVKQ